MSAQNPPDADRQQLEDIQQQLIRAWVTRDRSILERLLAPEWRVTRADGRVSTRDEVLFLRNKGDEYELFVQRARRWVNPFVLENWVMHSSTLILSVLIALFGVLPYKPLALTHRWLYILSGAIGLIMFGMTHFVGTEKA